MNNIVIILILVAVIYICLCSVLFQTDSTQNLPPQQLPWYFKAEPATTTNYLPVAPSDDLVKNYYAGSEGTISQTTLVTTKMSSFPPAVGSVVIPNLVPVPTFMADPSSYVDTQYAILPGIPVSGPAPAIGAPNKLDAEMSDWSQWANVGDGFEQRTRTCVHQGQNGGTLCGHLMETRSAN